MKIRRLAAGDLRRSLPEKSTPQLEFRYQVGAGQAIVRLIRVSWLWQRHPTDYGFVELVRGRTEKIRNKLKIEA